MSGMTSEPWIGLVWPNERQPNMGSLWIPGVIPGRRLGDDVEKVEERMMKRRSNQLRYGSCLEYWIPSTVIAINRY